MGRFFGIVFIVVLILSAFVGCKTKTICAAYHSHFLLFPEVQDKHFSLFGEDSLPKEELLASKKLWSGISEGPHNKKSYKKRHYIIPMKDVYREEADSSMGSNTINLDSVKNDRVFEN